MQARQKRLARFGGSGSPSGQASPATPPTRASSAPGEGRTDPAPSLRLPFSQPQPAMQQQAAGTVAASLDSSPVKTPFEMRWRGRLALLAQVFELQVNLDDSDRSVPPGSVRGPPAGQSLVALPTLRSELQQLHEEQGEVSALDAVTRALLGRFSADRPAAAPASFDWLIASFRRVEDSLRNRIKVSRQGHDVATVF